MPYATRLIREARAETAATLADAEFLDRLLDALAEDRGVQGAVRALAPIRTPPKQPTPRSTRR